MVDSHKFFLCVCILPSSPTCVTGLAWRFANSTKTKSKAHTYIYLPFCAFNFVPLTSNNFNEKKPSWCAILKNSQKEPNQKAKWASQCFTKTEPNKYKCNDFGSARWAFFKKGSESCVTKRSKDQSSKYMYTFRYYTHSKKAMQPLKAIEDGEK